MKFLGGGGGDNDQPNIGDSDEINDEGFEGQGIHWAMRELGFED